MSSEPVISASDLGKVYQLYDRPLDRLKQAFLWNRRRLYREFWALRGVSFEVRRGEVLGLIGRNGSGKSTLLQIICGVLKPSRGVATVRGRVAALLELGSGFNPEFTGRENVYMNGAILGLTRPEIEERFDEITHFAEIGKFIDQPVKTYSSGMVVRLAFAITAHVDADVLVVDEALSVGDAAFQFKCLHHLEDLLARGVTILLVSHDVQLVKSYCTRALYLKNNVVEFQGDCETATELYLKEMRVEKERMVAEANAHKSGDKTPAVIVAPGGRGEILSVRMGAGAPSPSPCTQGEGLGEGSSILQVGPPESKGDPHPNPLPAYMERGPEGTIQERTLFDCGERAWVEVHARVDPSVRRPRLTMYVRDIKGYGLFGLNNHHEKIELTPDRNGHVAGRFTFTTALRAGDYSIAVRLEESLGDTVTLPIDKKLNAVNFKVVHEARGFLGVVNLDGKFEEIRGS
jgi:lipopolysaccharide transport system ATP-binding protein